MVSVSDYLVFTFSCPQAYLLASRIVPTTQQGLSKLSEWPNVQARVLAHCSYDWTNVRAVTEEELHDGRTMATPKMHARVGILPAGIRKPP